MNSKTKTDERLNTIFDMVRKDVMLADVGCDHGFLITELFNKGIIKGGVATDINAMPLRKAELLVSGLKLEDKIRCVLTDGLRGIKSQEAQDIVVAGMGGELIFKIITDWDYCKEADKHFILQPMTKATYLRINMLKEGFSLMKEVACGANGKHYSVMNFCYSGEKIEYDEFCAFSYIGKILESPNCYSKDYIRGQVNMILKRAKGLKGKDDEVSQKLFIVAQELIEAGGIK